MMDVVEAQPKPHYVDEERGSGDAFHLKKTALPIRSPETQCSPLREQRERERGDHHDRDHDHCHCEGDMKDEQDHMNESEEMSSLSADVGDVGSDEDYITKKHLIVNYLPQSFSDSELYQVFTPFGELESVRIMRDTKTGYSFGFGFVNFVKEDEAIAAQAAMNCFEIHTKKIKVSFARPPSDDIKHTNLYITNLPRTITEDELIEIFKPFGPIIQKKLLRDKYTNLPRGVAFIRYEKRAQASNAITKLNNFVPPGCTEPLRIRLAEDHGKQKAAYLAGFQAGMVVPRVQDFEKKWRPRSSGNNRPRKPQQRPSRNRLSML